MVKQIEHKELSQILRASKARKVSPLLLGRTGIGKSVSIKDFAKAEAQVVGKKFVEWNESSEEMKEEIIANPKNYFCFLDIRLTQYEPSDIKGLPSFHGDTVVWKKNLWVKAFEKVDGVILFDEINLCPPLLQNSVYQIILDKQVGESPLNKNVMIIGAGNLTEDKANTFEIPKPIISRVMIYELRPPGPDAWVDWAMDQNVDNRVIGYIKANGHKLFHEAENVINVITPRGWEFVSMLIKDRPDLDEVELLSSGVLGDGGAIELTAFVKLTNKWDLDKILKNPKEAQLPGKIDELYSLVSALAEKYRGEKKHLVPLLKLTPRLKPDFAILLLRFVKRTDPEHFAQTVPNLKEWKTIADKYQKYLI